MISFGTLPCDEFAKDASEYPYKPSPAIAARIQHMENHISSKSPDFLAEPDWYINEWEALTGELIPNRYVHDLPVEITSFLTRGKGKGYSDDFVVKFLPLVSPDGSPLSYSDDNLVADFLKFNQKVYILKDSLLKQLT